MSTPTWTSADAVAFRQFLATTPHFIPFVSAGVPKIVDDKGTETAAMTGCTHGGAEKIIARIEEMRDHEVESARSPYLAE